MVYVRRFPPIIAVLCSTLANYGALPGSAVSGDSIYRVNRLPIIRWYQICSNEITSATRTMEQSKIDPWIMDKGLCKLLKCIHFAGHRKAYDFCEH